MSSKLRAGQVLGSRVEPGLELRTVSGLTSSTDCEKKWRWSFRKIKKCPTIDSDNRFFPNAITDSLTKSELIERRRADTSAAAAPPSRTDLYERCT
ncbi:hypothetical protein EVAR_90393_1 [Eumeta japonica]|uniref:Uncharacterized protein n=1 Tax=Eumeta variegata TaxID=151549 RepID=A0A4C1ZP56_EUMVA|nr:hypothetical protein EVAR_90393_1 [Eumeta japonica]